VKLGLKLSLLQRLALKIWPPKSVQTKPLCQMRMGMPAIAALLRPRRQSRKFCQMQMQKSSINLR